VRGGEHELLERSDGEGSVGNHAGNFNQGGAARAAPRLLLARHTRDAWRSDIFFARESWQANVEIGITKSRAAVSEDLLGAVSPHAPEGLSFGKPRMLRMRRMRLNEKARDLREEK